MHKLGFSLGILELKYPSFFGNICFSYDKNPNFELNSFKTNKPIKVWKNTKEIIYFNDFFYSCKFEMNSEKVITMIEEEYIKINMLSVDINKKNKTVGQIMIPLNDLKTSITKKTIQSYVKLVDKYYVIEDIEKQKDGIGKKIGELRIKIYLEDFGPTDYLDNSIFDEKEKKDNSKILIENQDIPNKQEYEDIEIKLIWELDNWKKSEESKFKYELKQKEINYLTNLKNEWNKKENDRENIFKNHQMKLKNIEDKLKNKANELQKRENKIVLLEEEWNQKIKLVSKEISFKDNEITEHKKKERNIKKKMKEKDNEINKLKNIIEDKNKELDDLKNYYEKSPINDLKFKLKEQINVNNELKRDIQKVNELKSEYKLYFEKMSKEIINLKQEKNNKDNENKLLKIQLIKKNELEDNIFNIKNQFKEIVNKNNEEKDINLKESSINESFSCEIENLKLKNLIKEKEEYLNWGYNINDDIVIELQNEIDKYNKNLN